MKRTLAVLGTAIVLSVGLVGCGGGYTESGSSVEEESGPETPSHEISAPGTSVFMQQLPDGREVLCVWAKSGRGGGLSCDWDSLAEGTVEGVE